MREREIEDPYWSDDLLVGELRLPMGAALVRLRLHQSAEPYDRRNVATLVPLTHASGNRSYSHAQPYVLEPEITLIVGLYPAPSTSGAVGEVVASDWEGMRHHEIGQAQAWYYPLDRLLLLWEYYLFDVYRRPDPVADPALAILWQGFEATLLARFPEAERVATPAWEDIYERPAWERFLSQQGYRPGPPGVFVKDFSAQLPHDQGG
jgi:hypothetical protein